MSAGQALTVDAAGDVSVSARGSLQTQDALRVAAGRDLALGGSLVMGDQDVRVQAGRNLRAGTVADSGSQWRQRHGRQQQRQYGRQRRQ